MVIATKFYAGSYMMNGEHKKKNAVTYWIWIWHTRKINQKLNYRSAEQKRKTEPQSNKLFPQRIVRFHSFIFSFSPEKPSFAYIIKSSDTDMPTLNIKPNANEYVIQKWIEHRMQDFWRCKNQSNKLQLAYRII